MRKSVTPEATLETLKSKLPFSSLMPWNVRSGRDAVDGLQDRVDLQLIGLTLFGLRQAGLGWPTR
jgi:hypothetical protein